MPAFRVEYRIHSATADVLGEERYPLALVHWDGKTLRLAVRQVLPSALAEQERALTRSLKSLNRQVEALGSAPLAQGLGELIDVRSGDGGGTQWSPVRVGSTDDPAAHFDELGRSLRLVETRASSTGISREDVATALTMLGISLGTDLGERVSTRRKLTEFEPYESPLSWLNHRWVHTLPLVVPIASRGHDAVRRVASTLDLAIPKDQRLVVAYVKPERPDVLDEFERGLEHLRTNGAGDRLRSAALAALDDEVRTDEVRALVAADIAS